MASGKTLYIKGDRDVEVTKPDVTLADLLSMECSDQSLLPKLKTMKILKFKKTGNQRCVISVLKIIACIHGQYPDMEVQNLGETDMIVTYEDQKTPSYAWHLTKTAFVTAVTFCASSTTFAAASASRTAWRPSTRNLPARSRPRRCVKRRTERSTEAGRPGAAFGSIVTEPALRLRRAGCPWRPRPGR